jgi:stage III sporulation protein AH
MLIIRRKNVIVGLLVVLLIITGYLNFVYNQSSAPAVNPEEGSPTTEGDPDKSGNEDQKDGAGSKISISDLEEPVQNQDSTEGSLQEDTKNPEDTETMASASSTFFRDYRFEREKDRNEEVAYIKSVVDNPKSDPEMVKEAQAQLLEITSSMESGLAIENLIKAKGINDAVVIIHKDNVSVIVDKPELVPEEVAMILDIVKRESGKETGNIKIIPKI